MTSHLLSKAVADFVAQKSDYYRNWTYDQPVIVYEETNQRLKKVGLLLQKFIAHVARNYFVNGYDKYMPLTERSQRVLAIFNQRDDYDVGTFRTDFVLDQNNQPKLIEITCRFAFNGYFETSVFNALAPAFARDQCMSGTPSDYYAAFPPYLEHKIGTNRRVCILVGHGKPEASKLYTSILEDAQIEVARVHYSEIEKSKALLASSLVISEITITEIESLSDRDLEFLARCRLLNDYRTVLIAHDKRFFELLANEALLSNVFSESERRRLAPFVLKTLSAEGVSEQCLHQEKNSWVLKHRSLGKSEGVFAGLEFSESEWRSLVASLSLVDYVAQEWVPQRRFKGTVKGEAHNDYVAGTLMYFDEQFFGVGLFRCSSHLVSNKVDDRKAFPLCVRSTDGSIPQLLAF